MTYPFSSYAVIMISFSLFFMDIYFKVWSPLHIRTRHLCFVKFYDIIKKCWDLNFSCWKSSCFLVNAEAMCSEVIFFQKITCIFIVLLCQKKASTLSVLFSMKYALRRVKYCYAIWNSFAMKYALRHMKRRILFYRSCKTKYQQKLNCHNRGSFFNEI